MGYQPLLARKLSTGLYGKLEFDFACNRGHGFGEAYLHGALVEILASNVDARSMSIAPSHPLPVLQTAGRRGRKREVDFVVASRNNARDVSVCIEAKWAGSSHASEERILLDLCRLALVSREYPAAACFFLLAGGKSDVARKCHSGVMAPHGGVRPKRLLRYPHDGQPNVYYLRSVIGAQSVLDASLRSRVAEQLPQLPDRVVSYLYKPSHDDPPDWSVQVWRISA